MRFHVVGLPYSQTTAEFSHCPFTTKVVRFSTMMRDLGNDVFLYSSDDNDAVCSEHINVFDKSVQTRFFGVLDKNTYFPVKWDPELPYWKHMNSTVIAEISKRIQPKDVICVIGGFCQKEIAEAFPNNFTVEFGIGYSGVFADFKVFESYAWMHYLYGKLGIDNGSYYDAVIPNYYPPSEFPLVEKKSDYFLYAGRITQRKGLEVANRICRELDKKLVVIGQDGQVIDHRLIGDQVVIDCDFEYLGTVTDPAIKAGLLGNAKAVLVPTQYIGPFESVHIEAAMCGTPVITTDWGAFTESVIHGMTGFRFRTLGEALWAADKVQTLDPAVIRKYALANYSMARVSSLYQSYFQQIETLHEDGWYDTAWNSGVSKFSRYSKRYPEL